MNPEKHSPPESGAPCDPPTPPPASVPRDGAAEPAGLSAEARQSQQLTELLMETTAAHRLLLETYCERVVVEPPLRQLIENYVQRRNEIGVLRRLAATASADDAVLLRRLVAANDASSQQILGFLASFKVQPFQAADGAFLPQEHDVVGRIATADPDMHFRVARTVRRGFRREQRVLRKACVELYTCNQEESS